MEEREVMEFDVLVVGGGPAGLSAAIKIKQQAEAAGTDISVCLIDKGSEIGAHMLSGAVIEARALDELFPNWKELGAPLNVPAKKDKVVMFLSDKKHVVLPNLVAPRTMHNGEGRYIISEANLARWLGEQAENLGVEIYPGFTALEVLFDEAGEKVLGVVTGPMGVGSDGQPKDGYVPSMELRAKYTLFAEGSRGHLGKVLIEKYNLAEGKDAQHYGIGVKEVWDIPEELHEEGLVIHGSGWPLSETKSTGGFFLYHAENNQIYYGLIADLAYKNPTMSPFEEMQLAKNHPYIKKYFEQGKRVAYGARAITKGGYNCLPKQSFPGGMLIGCDAGTLNFAKIKGVHMAMKSGMVAAETLVAKLQESFESAGEDLTTYGENWTKSWAGKELRSSRNFGPAMHKFGDWFGGMYNFIEQNILFGKSPITLHDAHPDYERFEDLSKVKVREYPKPDNKITFDKLSSVFLANVYHEEDQPCHLRLTDAEIPLKDTLPKFGDPLCRVCPAGVYEIVGEGDEQKFQINFANCLHCKTCDIKDPAQNITWVTPEGGGGPNYPNM